MTDLSSLSDSEIAARLPGLVRAERHAMVDLIEHLVEVERRRLYLPLASPRSSVTAWKSLAMTRPTLDAPARVVSSLCDLGFGRSEASAAVGHALGNAAGLDVEQLLRKCLLLLVPKAG